MQCTVMQCSVIPIMRMPMRCAVQVSTAGVEAAAQMMVAEADAIAALARATRPDLLVQVWPLGYTVGRYLRTQESRYRVQGYACGPACGGMAMGCIAKRFRTDRCMPDCNRSGKVHGTTEVEVAAQVDREQVSGAVNLVFAGRPLTNTYRNLTNVVLRVAPARGAARPAVLVNAHFDRRSLHSTSPGGLRHFLPCVAGGAC